MSELRYQVFEGRNILLFTILCVALLGCNTSPVSSITAYTEEKRIVYAGPHVRDYDEIGTLPQGARISLLGRSGDSWVLFDYGGNKGWIQSFYLEIDGNHKRLAEFDVQSLPVAGNQLSQGNSSDYISSTNAGDYIGDYKTVQIRNASCSYQSSIEGTPTFCNDTQYPNHNFTLVVWENDWSSLDGGCLLVTGNIVVFQGKPEIVVTSSSQVSRC